MQGAGTTHANFLAPWLKAKMTAPRKRSGIGAAAAENQGSRRSWWDLSCPTVGLD